MFFPRRSHVNYSLFAGKRSFLKESMSQFCRASKLSNGYLAFHADLMKLTDMNGVNLLSRCFFKLESFIAVVYCSAGGAV